jgi:type I restriction-modification system DNA methylase subunit/predicted type IV restriction endonuclease
MSAPENVRELVNRFDKHLDAYRSGKYNETQLRREFLDPFFEALGWDVFNKQGYAETYKDVIHEDSLEIEGENKAPDYAFRVGGQRKFFVEAKKPAVNIEMNIHPAFQLRRYAWSAKLPLGILSDFEEFAVYDCRVKPDKKDKASVGRVMLLSYKDYVEKWDELVSIFSRDAILKGSFDSYAEGMKTKKGTTEVDDAFLSEIERWRDLLAKNIALRNQSLSVRELNYAVQMTIDRIVFLRICEDRGVERDEQLKEIASGDDIYKGLVQLFQRADARYNSGLFHFTAEKNESSPADSLTLGLNVDDKPLRDILLNLYYPDSPYVFREIPSDILGQVYERFLGKVIRLTAGHQAKVEEKPEVRKAGGVYYTPTYIVNYIVRNTVGKLLEGKTPKDVVKLKILDPACGSGTFPLGAYQYLLDWHLDWFINHEPEKLATGKNPPIFQSKDGWALTTSKKKEILLNNIYGVDIDAQAVEVTKLSLLLKVLEGESQETIGSQLSLLQERVLPDLSKNIQCGNSLIGPDYYEGHQLTMGLGDDEERYRVNAFDWKGAFPQVFIHGGFDAVIGNPPYVDIKSLPNPEVRFLFSRYYSANNRINLFAIFIEKVFEIINQNNFRFSMIVPTALLTQDSYKKLREPILGKYQIENITRLPNESFGSAAGNVKVDTAIFVFSSSKTENAKVEIIAYEGYNRIKNIDADLAKVHGFVEQSEWQKNEDSIWSINLFNNEDAILSKIEAGAIPLEDCTDISLGLTPYDKYKGHTPSQIENQVFHADHQKDETFRKLLAGNDVRRYSLEWNGEKWISYGSWLGAPREKKFFTERRILVKQIIDWTTKRIWAVITDEELYNTQNAFNILAKSNLSIEYLLGVLNSKMMTFYHQKRYLDEFKMRFQKILIKDCRRFPVHPINFSDTAEKAQHDKMVLLVERMLTLHKQNPRTPQEQEMVKREIESTDRAIDKLVYELYGLTEEEIKIVEDK